jgi:DNA-binding CsgD family transcriptional regulator
MLAQFEAALDSTGTMGWLSELARIAGIWGRVRPADRSTALPVAIDLLVEATEAGMVLPSMYRCLAPVSEALWLSGRRDDAERFIDVLRSAARDLDAPLAIAALAQADGYLASASGNWELAVERHAAAAASFSDVTMAYEAARAHEDAAIASCHCGYGSTVHLSEALATYQRLGARWDLDRASGLARRCGASVPARHRNGPIGYGDQLSPREREVAVLAAQGYTDAEIAKRLVVSIHTVVRHMMSVRRKLGLHSRRELRSATLVAAGSE